MNNSNLNKTRNPAPALCHLPGTFFKDLQTNFPETFRAHSGIHRSCFTLPFFTKNRQKLEPPQPAPATSVGTVSRGLVSPYVTFRFAALARDHRLRFHPGPFGPSVAQPILFRLLSPSIYRIPATNFSPNNVDAHTHECIAPVRAPNGAPGCSHRWSKAPRSKPSATGGKHPSKNPTPAGVKESLECAQKITQTRTTPTLVRHICWHNPRTRCVTICHFRFAAPRASPVRSSTCRIRCNRCEYVRWIAPSLDCQRLGYES